jgi:hypothetical protein
VSDRRAEDHQRGVADELFEEAVILFDHIGHLAVQNVLQRAHVLGIQALAQGDKSREVGEQHGHRTPVGLAIRRTIRCWFRRGLGNCRRRFWHGFAGQCGPAFGGKRKFGGTFGAARRACGMAFGSAFRAKREIGRNFGAAACAVHDLGMV